MAQKNISDAKSDDRARVRHEKAIARLHEAEHDIVDGNVYEGDIEKLLCTMGMSGARSYND